MAPMRKKISTSKRPGLRVIVCGPEGSSKTHQSCPSSELSTFSVTGSIKIIISWLRSPEIALVCANPTSDRALNALDTVIRYLTTKTKIKVAVPVSLSSHVESTIPIVLNTGDPPFKEEEEPFSTPAHRLSIIANRTREKVRQADLQKKHPAGESSRKIYEVNEIDVVITIGGDGTLLYVLREMFDGPVPPVIPFNVGSLGFLTPFDISRCASQLSSLLKGETEATLRMRLNCKVISTRTEIDSVSASEKSKRGRGKKAAVEAAFHEKSDTENEFQVLNEVAIKTVSGSNLCQLSVSIDDHHITSLQGDGAVISTSTGSTAYAMSAGSNPVHPALDVIIIAPLNAHTLTARPLIVPSHHRIEIKVPVDARSDAVAIFDGAGHTTLALGDAVVVSRSPFSVPSLCVEDGTQEWFSGLKEALGWNERVIQASPRKK